MIVIKDLYIYNQYYNKILVKVDQQIFDGNQVWFIQGASGAGKTIFLQTISKNFFYYSGNILIDEKIIEYYAKRDFAKKLQFLDQNYTIFTHMSIYEQLLDMLEKVLVYPVSDIQNIIFEHLDAVGLLSHRFKYASELSGGQRQRVALVQKVILNTDYLLLDEPTSALDSESKKLVLNYINYYCKNKTNILISTHDREVLSYFEKQKTFIIETIEN